MKYSKRDCFLLPFSPYLEYKVCFAWGPNLYTRHLNHKTEAHISLTALLQLDYSLAVVMKTVRSILGSPFYSALKYSDGKFQIVIHNVICSIVYLYFCTNSTFT